MTHFKERCKYGFMHRQCRCPGGEVTIVDCDKTLHKKVQRTALEWAAIHKVVIMDPDGWRHNNDNVDMDTPITFDDFKDRTLQSTVRMLDKNLFDL